MLALEWRALDTECDALYINDVRIAWVAIDVPDQPFTANYRLPKAEWGSSRFFNTRKEAENYVLDAVLPFYLPKESSA